MALLKVVSGTIWTSDQQRGLAVIDWTTRRMHGDVRKTHIRAIGPRGPFKNKPIVTVSLRAIRLVSGETGSIEDFNLDTKRITKEQAEIRWNASGASRVTEISFLAVGESG